jgi:hypothetical protein
VGFRILCGVAICATVYVVFDVIVATVRLSMTDSDEDELAFIRYDNGGLQDRWYDALDPR